MEEKSNQGKILVTGGAGFIGSHTVAELLKQGREVIVLDNLSTGKASAVSCPLIVGDLADKALLNRVFEEYEISSVIHFAGSIVVEESVLFPEKYFENNIVNGLNLLHTMVTHNIKKIIFSSSAAVYGNPQYLPIDEDHAKVPTNPYGETKLMFEKILKWYAKAYDVSSVILRYFNAAGASADASIGENMNFPTHLIPRVLRVAGRQQSALQIYGNDYPTSDGTCIRDYIHVVDLAQAHILSLDKLAQEQGYFVYNVGTGHGYSVSQVVDMVMEVTGKMVEIEMAQRRPGDPAMLVADPSKIKQELGFNPQYSDLKTIVQTAWAWYCKLHQLQVNNRI